MNVTNEVRGFVIVRVDRTGAIPRTYLRSFAPAGRNGLQRVAFGERSVAHAFESRTEAEDVARRLGRRISGTTYDYRVEQISQEALASP